jgi:hypothetical protein
MLANSDDLAGRPYRIRTCDTLIKRQVLYQLSYSRIGALMAIGVKVLC